MSGKQWESRPNSGSLFVNTNKKSENAPDYSGTITIGGDLLEEIRGADGTIDIKIAGWKKTSQKTGTTFLSLSVQSGTQGNGRAPAKKPVYSNRRTEKNDDAPWD